LIKAPTKLNKLFLIIKTVYFYPDKIGIDKLIANYMNFIKVLKKYHEMIYPKVL